MRAEVALLTPSAAPAAQGNAVTVARIVHGLAGRGIRTLTCDLSAMSESAIATAVAAARPEVIHAFHARRAGPLALALARDAALPLVVTLTGTDINHDLLDPAAAPRVRATLEGAAAIVAFHESMRARVTAALPALAARIVVIPQAPWIEDGVYELERHWPLPADRVLFVFPAGVRPVKRPRLPLAPLARLRTRRPGVRLAYAGPILDAEEGDRLLADLAGLSWARYLGAVPHAAMASLMRSADVILNCSASEGGMANAVLEAMAVGRAVAAADIEGNRSLIVDGVTGLLFADADALLDAAERLAADADLRRRLGAAARELVEREYRPALEIDRHVALYRRLGALPV